MSSRDLKVGDLVEHDKKRYIVAATKGWIHKGGWISLCQTLGEIALLARISEVRLIRRRETISRHWWTFFPKGEEGKEAA